MRSPEDGSFGRPSPVWKYWLAHCEGFTVESRSGRTVGLVESIGVDPTTARFVVVVRRRRLFRRRRLLLSAERVSLVMPWSETLVLGRAPERTAAAPARALAVAGAGFVFLLAFLTVAGRRSGAALGALGGRAYRRSPELVAHARPLVRAGGLAGARGLRSGGRLGFRLLRVAVIGLAVLAVVFVVTLLLLAALLREATPVVARRVKAGMLGVGKRVRRRAPAAAAALRKGWSHATSALVDAGPRVRTLPRLSSRR